MKKLVDLIIYVSIFLFGFNITVRLFFSLVFEFFFVIHRDLLMQIITFVFLFFALFLL